MQQLEDHLRSLTALRKNENKPSKEALKVMFNSCRLSLRQKISGIEKWAEVKILKPYYATNVYNQPTEEQMIAAYAKGYLYSGRWQILSNSQTGIGTDNDAYTIGSSAPQQDKFWRWSVAERQLQFIERHKVTGTGEYGSTETKLKIVVTLERAWLVTSGIYPLGNAVSETGTVIMGSNLFVSRHPLTWEWVP
jgi:hypothetical protein